MIGFYLVIAVLAISLLLVIGAAILPKFRHYKWQPPLKKVEPKKKIIRHKMKKKKHVWIKIL